MKKWEKFKTDYEKKLLFKNSILKASDILQFMRLFIISNDEIENNEMKKYQTQNYKNINIK